MLEREVGDGVGDSLGDVPGPHGLATGDRHCLGGKQHLACGPALQVFNL